MVTSSFGLGRLFYKSSHQLQNFRHHGDQTGHNLEGCYAYTKAGYLFKTFFWSAICSSTDTVGPDDFLWPEEMGWTLVAGDTLGELSRTAGSGAEETLVFGVAIFDDGGEALLPVLSKEPLDPNDCNKLNMKIK